MSEAKEFNGIIAEQIAVGLVEINCDCGECPSQEMIMLYFGEGTLVNPLEIAIPMDSDAAASIASGRVTEALRNVLAE